VATFGFARWGGVEFWIGYLFDDETITFSTITHGPPEHVTRWWERPDPDE
jgi:hypothetical protein